MWVLVWGKLSEACPRLRLRGAGPPVCPERGTKGQGHPQGSCLWPTAAGVTLRPVSAERLWAHSFSLAEEMGAQCPRETDHLTQCSLYKAPAQQTPAHVTDTCRPRCTGEPSPGPRSRSPEGSRVEAGRVHPAGCGPGPGEVTPHPAVCGTHGFSRHSPAPSNTPHCLSAPPPRRRRSRRYLKKRL